MTSLRTNRRIGYLRRAHFRLHQTALTLGTPPHVREALHDGLKRMCPTYSYWNDLVMDLRRPENLLDFVNQILRRFRRALIETIHTDSTGRTETTWQLERMFDYLERVHNHGHCEICRHPDVRRFVP